MNSEVSKGGKKDAYVEYIDRFFRKWLPVYDLFGATIFPVYRSAANLVGAEPGLKVLDVCTGTGEMALRLARKGAVVTGVDVTSAMLEKAKRKAGDLPIDFRLADARHMDFPDKSFDVSVLSLALHDMPRKVRLEVLRETARVTRSRIVIVDYDFPESPWLRRSLVRLVQLFETVYLTGFADEGVLPHLKDVGLEQVDVKLYRPLVFGSFVVHLPVPS
jgi:ubiquinone/menaquinone biosynthesis C-methylase UbiE